MFKISKSRRYKPCKLNEERLSFLAYRAFPQTIKLAAASPMVRSLCYFFPALKVSIAIYIHYHVRSQHRDLKP